MMLYVAKMSISSLQPSKCCLNTIEACRWQADSDKDTSCAVVVPFPSDAMELMRAIPSAWKDRIYRASARTIDPHAS